MKHIVTLEEFLQRLKEKHGDSIEYVSGYKNTQTKCMFRCKKDGHTWFATPNSILSGRGCPICAIKKRAEKQTLPIDRMLQRIKELYGDLIKYIGGYKSTHKKCWWQCKIDGCVWSNSPHNLFNGIGCPMCSIERKRKLFVTPLEELIEKVKIITNGEIEYVEGYINTSTNCKWKCVKCGHIWETTPQHILHGSKCPKCMIKIRANRVVTPLLKLIEKVKIISNGLIEYVSGYLTLSKKCKWRCVICGNEWENTPYHILEGQGCPVCKKYSMEKPVLEALKKKGIKTFHDKSLEGSNYNGSTHPLRADFYIETSKGVLVIETDGRQHFEVSRYTEPLEIIQARDRHKDKYCKEHGYVLIRVTSSPTKEWGFKNHITLYELLNLIEVGINSETKEIDFELFRKYDFNRT